ncbi:MAG: ABC transporter ATP-binding protein [Spirochaetaceae bacterium]|nr:ABC transporter ATP-binding protein [Spirochaetaceae bacterium]
MDSLEKINLSKDVQIENLTVVRGKKSIYKDFSIKFEAGTVNALLAPSGAGKTTLLDCIAALLEPSAGTIKVGGKSIKEYGEKALIYASYLFQEPRLLPWCSVLRNCTLPLENTMPKDEAVRRAEAFLCAAGLKDKINDFPPNLSGGERQRAAVARSFAVKAPLLLMDEAFQSQDIMLKEQLMQLLKELLETERRTVLFVTHDIRESLEMADRIIILKPLSKQDSTLHVALDALTKDFESATLRDKILETFAAG